MLAHAMPLGQFRFEELGQVGAGGLGRVDKIRITATSLISSRLDQPST